MGQVVRMSEKMELRKFVTPEIITGIDARRLVGQYISHFGTKKPMIVTDNKIRKQNWYMETLETIKVPHVVFDDVTENPKDYEAMLESKTFLDQDCDLIIAIGGGSVMDCAKCISVLVANGGNILDYEGVDEVNLPGPPLICIPSTAGTAADVSQFAIICDTLYMVKKAIISKKIVPDLALLDPVPLMTMEPYLTACTGMDALTHAIEAYVSNAQSPLTDVHALEAIKLLNENIEAAIREDRTIDTMYQMMLGSLQAGLAFSNASLGAVHAMAHSLGGFFNLPHGECNSILLEHIIEINFDAVPDRFRRIAEQLNVLSDSNHDLNVKEEILKRIKCLRENLMINATVGIDQIDGNQLNILVENAMTDPCMVTNPKKLTKQEVKVIYERIFRRFK
jgi:alcohol dehydrogenase class IV